MWQCREELLRKKNSIIQELRSTQMSISDMIKTDPRVWDDEYFHFDLNSQATLLLKADIFVHDPAQRDADSDTDADTDADTDSDTRDRSSLFQRKPNSMQLFVRIYGRWTRTIILEVEPSHTFKKLKDMIQEKEGIPQNQQSLNYFGRRLSPNPILMYNGGG